MLKYRDPQSSWSAHYLDFRNRKSVFLCYYQTATRKRFYMAIWLSFEDALMPVPASWIWINTETKCIDEASVTHAVDSLFYSYSPKWGQHFEKHTILAYLYHLRNTMTTNDYKWAKIVIYSFVESIVWRLVVCDLNFRSECDFMEIQSAPARKLCKIPEKKKLKLLRTAF